MVPRRREPNPPPALSLLPGCSICLLLCTYVRMYGTITAVDRGNGETRHGAAAAAFRRRPRRLARRCQGEVESEGERKQRRERRPGGQRQRPSRRRAGRRSPGEEPRGAIGRGRVQGGLAAERNVRAAAAASLHPAEPPEILLEM